MRRKITNRNFGGKELAISCFWILHLLITACERESSIIKDDLIGEKEVFVGSWNWIYTNRDYGFCDGQYLQEQLTPMTENITFSLDFISSGMVYFYKQDSLISEYRLVFNKFQEEPEHCMILNAHSFQVYLDGDGSKNLLGCLNQDTMRLSVACGFLFVAESSCEIYQNYFLKE